MKQKKNLESRLNFLNNRLDYLKKRKAYISNLRETLRSNYEQSVREESKGDKNRVKDGLSITENKFKSLTNSMNQLDKQILLLEGGKVTKEFKYGGKTYKKGDMYSNAEIDNLELQLIKFEDNKPKLGIGDQMITVDGEKMLKSDYLRGTDESNYLEHSGTTMSWLDKLKIKNNESKLDKTAVTEDD
tara:strand:+ start:80 stop:640 length:561 start_codon:yes stop_codon:yes gene_type:complete